MWNLVAVTIIIVVLIHFFGFSKLIQKCEKSRECKIYFSQL